MIASAANAHTCASAPQRRRFPTRRAAGALALALLAAGCATPGAGPVEVTRFARPELADSRAGGVSVVARAGGGSAGELAGGLVEDTAVAAVARELARLGYASAPTAATVAEVTLSREVVSAAQRRRGPVSVGVGGGTGGYGSGVGLGIGIDLSRRPRDTVRSLLSVTLRDRASGRAVWEGRASFVAPVGTPLGSAPAAADRLAQALFKGFPGNSGETVTVR